MAEQQAAVAISPDGVVGSCWRDGQKGLSTACGACIGALNAVEAEKGQHLEFGLPDADYQMQTIVQLAPSKTHLTAVYEQPQSVDSWVPV